MAPHPALAVRGKLARAAFAMALLASLAVLFAPASDVPSAPAGVDKVVHLALFAALASSGRWAGVGSRVLVPLLLVYAAVSEVVQGLPALNRSMSVADWIADAIGVLLGLALWGLAARRTPTPR
ncbi:VanZ family protein [Blastococcus goldschmidtiae]|uniref:VanZ family protein n=1 Tax=Blastococcus goldschmidtiae TaxID=3075546 RepID=A0ABU2KAI8_9ACTN|nr:VanZ family protein [Blastococcus sp. DSM 46792]MDT0277158.1 VanZ family protein [Blastococcus sp. DSM 46792]